MEFGFSEEQENFRKEVHDWFVENLPEDYDGTKLPHGKESQAFEKQLAQKVGGKGWLTANWPKEYGGLGLSNVYHGIILEELGRWKGAWANYTGVDTAGPAMLHFASEEHKKKYLPPISRGEVVWDQLFTEPDAGSDEANIKLKAEDKGDYFLLNGQKMFVGDGWKPDFLYTEVRTADTTPKHRGLSLLIVPGDADGLTYRPLPCMGGWHKEEIFFDDVKVPKENLIGELNRGFYHAMQTLAYERTRTGGPMGSRQWIEDFVWYCKHTERNGKRVWDDPEVRDTIAQIVVENKITRLEVWRTCSRGVITDKPEPLGYSCYGSWAKALSGFHSTKMINIMGLYGLLKLGSKHAQLRGWQARRWEASRSMHMGGTPEILKVVAAERVLGLPRRR